MSVALAAVVGLPALVHADVFPAGGGVITFTKSVGLSVLEACNNPAQVGLTVAPGTQVTYCYAIESSDKITLTLQELDDDQLGQLFTGPQVLPPLTPFTVTATTPIFKTTINTVTWNLLFTSGLADTVGSDPSVTVNGTARVSVPTASQAPTMSGVGLALVAVALLTVGAMQLSRGRRRDAERS
ncbi:MAG: hypothetical protein ACHQ4J_04975 [Candidatus Binatia bacterium]